ncbi:MAG TPA: BTAD domain-containing putative transcriptional regulator [Acidimicrobiia bacterium]
MQFGILGRLEVATEGRVVEVKGPKLRALLILLLLHPNRVVSAEAIIEALWGQELSGREGATLRVHVANLRRALSKAGEFGEYIVTRAPGYLIEVDPESIDVVRFERLVAEGRRLLPGDAPHAAELLIEALGMWRGSALEDVAYESFAQGEVRRLEELRLTAVEDLAEARLTMDGHAGLVGELESLVATHPLRERLWGQLMVALYRSGRQADSLSAYRRLSRLLGEELGLEPGPELRLLEDRILANDPTLLKPALRIGPHRRPPAERTRLIGRTDLMTELQAKMKTGQLLTLTGTGGVGKTRLAQRLAWSLLAGDSEVWWVELGELADPQLIPDQIAAAGGIAQGPDMGTPELLGRLLWGRDLVIVLDNCEHLVDECARLVDELLTQAPGLKFIVTSREPLQVQGELVVRVPSLPVPDETSDGAALAANPSIELFLERANARNITVEESSLPTVATICRRLDGIPLAIELAAARSTTFTPDELSNRLNDRFLLLERGGRTALARHRTLEAAIDWSFRLLSPFDQQLLSRLAVFVTSFDIEAARAVCGFDPIEPEQVTEGIERLVEKSMLEPLADPGQRRFRFTESIHAFAWDRLPDQPEMLISRHRDWALSLARAGGAGILENEGLWFPQLEHAYGEFRAAFNESLRRGEAEIGLRLVGSLGAFLMWRHTNEALEWLERAVAAGRESSVAVKPSTMALGLLSLGPYLCYHNRFEEGCEALAAAAAQFTQLGQPARLMWARYQQSFFPRSGDPQECVEFAEEALALARPLASPVLMAYALTRLAETTLLAAGQKEVPPIEVLERVLAICDEAEVYCDQLPQSYASGVAKVASGSAIALLGQEEEGFALIDQGLDERGRFHVGVPCAAALVSAGHLAFRLGYEDRAAALLLRGLAALKGEGLPYSGRSALVGAAASLRKRQPVIAARLLGAAGSLRPSFVYGSCMFDDEDAIFDQVRSDVGNDTYHAELGYGQRLGARNAIDLAISHLG